MKDEPSADEQRSEQDERRGEDAGGLGKVDGRRYAKNQGDRDADETQTTEEGEWLVRTEQVKDLEADREAIAVRPQLGEAALGSRAVFDVHLGDRHVVEERLDGHLRLDLEAARDNWQDPRDLGRERAVARENVCQPRAPNDADDLAEDHVARVMETPERASLGTTQPRAYDHVARTIEDRLDEVRDAVRRVRRVRVEHDVDISFDPLEHRANDVAFSLAT